MSYRKIRNNGGQKNCAKRERSVLSEIEDLSVLNPDPLVQFNAVRSSKQ